MGLISSGSGMRFCGFRLATHLIICGGFPARKSGVSTAPGEIAFTVMPRWPRSFASIRTSCSTAPFDVQNRSPMGSTVDARVSALETNTMRPPAHAHTDELAGEICRERRATHPPS